MLIRKATDLLPNRCVRWAKSFIWLRNFTIEESLFIEHFWARNSQLLAHLFVYRLLEVSCHSGSCACNHQCLCINYGNLVLSRGYRLPLDSNKASNESSTLWVFFSWKSQNSSPQAEIVVLLKVFRYVFNWFYALVLSLNLVVFSLLLGHSFIKFVLFF